MIAPCSLLYLSARGQNLYHVTETNLENVDFDFRQRLAMVNGNQSLVINDKITNWFTILFTRHVFVLISMIKLNLLMY